jgi:hypothetical protein
MGHTLRLFATFCLKEDTKHDFKKISGKNKTRQNAWGFSYLKNIYIAQWLDEKFSL